MGRCQDVAVMQKNSIAVVWHASVVHKFDSNHGICVSKGDVLWNSARRGLEFVGRDGQAVGALGNRIDTGKSDRNKGK